MNKPLITVFTPTFNREKCISKCYESLCRQTKKDFLWLVVDDGSTDNTSSLISQWMKENDLFEIRYFYKSNGGLHTAYNTAIELCDTELFMCIDSDDWLPDDAIAEIVEIWRSIDKSRYAGMMGVDCYEDGRVVGDYFPDNVNEMYLYEKLVSYKTSGDKKMIHRSDYLKKVAPMPVYNREKNFNPSYLMYQVDQFGPLYVTNKCFCIVNYQPDGMSSNIFTQYYNSPRSFAETRKLYLSFPKSSFFFKFKQYIHYDSSCLFAHNLFNGLCDAPNIALASLALLPATLLSVLVLIKADKG